MGRGIALSDGQLLSEFTICTADRKFHTADVKIVGGTVVVTATDISDPVAV